MATEKTEKVKTEAVTPNEAPESVYTVRELADGHQAFGVPKEIVAVALRLAEKESFTFPEAKRIVDEFSKKEV